MTKYIILILTLGIVTSLLAQNYLAQYNDAIDLIESGKTTEARAILEKVAQFPVETGLRDNAEYWIGVSYFDEKKYDLAIEHYRKAQYQPDYNKAAAAQYELAYAKELSGDSTGAVIEFHKIATLYPNSGLTERADSCIKAIGGDSYAAIKPDYGPGTPSNPTSVGTTRPSKRATPVSLEDEPRPDAPLTDPEEDEFANVRPDAPLDGPVIATEGPLTGAELPVARASNKPSKVAQPLEMNAEPAPEPPKVEEAPPKVEEAIQPAEPKTEATNETSSPQDAEEDEVIYDDSAPLDVDPAKLIRPEDKAGWE